MNVKTVKYNLVNRVEAGNGKISSGADILLAN